MAGDKDVRAGFIVGFIVDQDPAVVFSEGADDLAIDRNRQVWTAINELLDTVATFFGEEPVPRSDLCAMLEACLSARTIKSLPQLSRAVMVAPPQMFFSSGIRRMIVMGVQEDEISPVPKALSEQELHQLEREEIRSAMKPYKISRKLESNDTVSTVSPQELEEIQRLALDVTTGLVNRIRRGEADPRPVRDGKESPCAFCDHAESCLFDPTIPGCSVREVGHKRRVEPGSDQSVS